LLRILIAAHDVIVQHSLDLPLISLLICHPGKMMASVEPLPLACDGEKNDRRREFHLAENPSAFQAHSRAAGIVVRARSGSGYI